ncbi:hypothetical protein A9P82_02105 [Arachidicoccus ginsenosidimutans]|uniref:DUF4249 family protein n=1 Tax=Arachidicoccus sp. BS20 TaxID=1850526 RepID=UPI0007F0D943|nr:DUF4249 family protein [Arachidicoccus sp. BS20]ANI88208.1 hypothetical protein A9P82_02105 [Arachidicoccus sp. BS20]
MKRKTIILVASVVLGFTACDKEVNLNLDSTSPQVVIEGVVSNEAAYVRITKTINFAAQNIYPGTDGAKIYIKDSNSNHTDTLHAAKDQNGNAVYKATALKGVAGHTYQLTVFLNGKTYKATSRMPQKVPLQGLSTENSSTSQSLKVFVLLPVFDDPKGIKNYYRFEQYVNHIQDSHINVFNDELEDGLPNVLPVVIDNANVKVGDSITVTMMDIDKNVYQYFYQLSLNSQITNLSPANPVSNISGGALGYFSAEYRQTKSIVVNKL